MGCPGGTCSDRRWHVVRRMANCAYDGIPANEAETGQRLLCRDCRSNYFIRSYAGRNSGVDDSYDNWRNRRSRCDSKVVGGEMGCRAQNRLGMGVDNPNLGLNRGPFLPGNKGHLQRDEIAELRTQNSGVRTMVFGLEYRMLRPYCSSPGTMNSVNVVSASAFCVLCPVFCLPCPVSYPSP